MLTWKYWDVAIAVVGFLVQCGLALMGLTMTHWKHKAQFGVLVLVGMLFTGFAVKRGVDSANRVQAQLDTIARNTERPTNFTVTPTPVTVNPPPVIVKPPIPTEAKLQFSFWPVGPGEQLVDTISKPLVNGIVATEFTAKNIGTAQADNGQIWIQICDGCKFAEEPSGSTVPDNDPIVRRKRFDTLHMGSYFESTQLKIIPPIGVSTFTIAFKYACEKCSPIDNSHPQKLRINVVTQRPAASSRWCNPFLILKVLRFQHL